MIDLAHGRFDMKVAVVVCANTMGNQHAADYTYQERPYFRCERKINPRDSAAVQQFLTARATVFRLIANADTLTIIDSDPGGYIGSTNAEFVELVQKQVELFRRFNGRASFDYWMLYGWETYNEFWARIAASNGKMTCPAIRRPRQHLNADVFAETLRLCAIRLRSPGGFTLGSTSTSRRPNGSGWSTNARTFPYGLIESEPSFPLVEYSPAAIAEGIAQVPVGARPRGLLGNAQTHCLQLPHLCLFAHDARGGTDLNVAIHEFGDNLLPGHGELLVQAWEAIGCNDPQIQRSLAARVPASMGGIRRLGPCSGLAVWQCRPIPRDLADNLLVRAALVEFGAVLAQWPGAPAGLAAVPRMLRRVPGADRFCRRLRRNALPIAQRAAGPLGETRSIGSCGSMTIGATRPRATGPCSDCSTLSGEYGESSQKVSDHDRT